MEFKKLTEELPPAKTLVMVQRKKGPHYIGFRQDKPLSDNPDPSVNCYWRGAPIDDLTARDHDGAFANCSFSDVTVESWAYLSAS